MTIKTWLAQVGAFLRKSTKNDTEIFIWNTYFGPGSSNWLEDQRGSKLKYNNLERESGYHCTLS